MRKHKVEYDRLPGIGELFEFTTCSDFAVTIVTHRSGRRELAVGVAGQDEPLISVPLTRSEAIVVATLLSGAHIELTPTSRSWPNER